MNLFVLFVDGVSIQKKNDGNFASCTMCNDAVSRHFCSDGLLHHNNANLDNIHEGTQLRHN
jgi:hypothetical protein